MPWDFETDPEYQSQLNWVEGFVRDEVEPLELVLGSQYDKADPRAMSVVRPLQERVRARGLWACHLGPELGGPGYGQLKLALLNEKLGRSRWAPSVFGCQAPDSGNGDILARYGTNEQKTRYLNPLLNGDIISCFVMTEPQAGADPALFTTRAERVVNILGPQRRKVVCLPGRFSRVLHCDGGDRPACPRARGHVDVHRRSHHTRHRDRRNVGPARRQDFTPTSGSRTFGSRQMRCSAARGRRSPLCGESSEEIGAAIYFESEA